jgi:abequosyltransferase
MQKYLLAVCIPTYNRSKYLKGLLENISLELEKYDNFNDIQIIIVDGHSDDDTEEMINAFKIRCELKYYRRQAKEGIDKDIIKCVQLSDAEYCWLFSDDDRFTDGAISYLLGVLRKDHELSGCFCNRVSFDFTLERKVAEVNEWPGNILKKDRLFVEKSECIKNIGMDFGFISSQVVNSSRWKKAVGNEDYGDLYKSYYLMVHIIFKMMNEDCRWLYIHRPLVMQRTGNDTLLNKEGVIKRQTIEHESFEIILNYHYDQGAEEHYVFFKKMVTRLPRVVANLKSQKISYSTQVYLFKLLFKKYRRYSQFWYLVVPVFFIPNILFFYVKKFYFKYLV